MPTINDIEVNTFKEIGFKNKKEAKDFAKKYGIAISKSRMINDEDKIINFLVELKNKYDELNLSNTILLYNTTNNNITKIESWRVTPLIKRIKKDKEYKNYIITNELENVRINTRCHYSVDLIWSIISERRTGSLLYTGSTDINSYTDFFENYFRNNYGSNEFRNLKVEFESNKIYNEEGLPINYDDYILNDYNSLLIDNPNFKDYIITNNNITGDNTCVYDYLLNELKKDGKTIYLKDYKELFIDGNVKVCELKDFIIQKGIKFTAYDIKGNILFETPKVNKCKGIKNLYGLIHNNHLYGLKGAINFIHSKNTFTSYDNIIYLPSLEDKLKNIIENENTEPSELKLIQNGESKCTIKSFIYNNSFYTTNENYRNCIEIYNKFINYNDIYKLENFNPNLSIHSLLHNLFNEYTSKNKLFLQSLFPNSSNFSKGGYTYRCEKYTKSDITESRDCNKAYVHTAKNLPFLPVINYLKCTPKIYKGEELIDHYFYSIKTNNHHILINDSNLYCGVYLKEVAKRVNLEYEILEYIEAEKHDNILEKFISDIEKLFPFYDINGNKISSNEVGQSMLFSALVRVFGRFHSDKSIHNDQYVEFDRICTDEEIISSGADIGGYSYNSINDKYHIKFSLKNKNKSVFNMKPIGIMIIDFSKLHIYDYLVKNEISYDNIVQIRTDSIYIANSKFLYPADDIHVLGGFKHEDIEFKDLIISDRDWDGESKSLFLNTHLGNNCKCILQYAGAGKTYNIINNVIPNLKNYIVCSPRHKALQEYRLKNINCMAIATKTKIETLMKYDNIIIDEIGMCDVTIWYKIIRLISIGKSVQVYGDFTQFPDIDFMNKWENDVSKSDYIPSVFGTYNENIIKYLFNEVKFPNDNFINYRNNFKSEYYDNLKNGILMPLIEVQKYSKNLLDLDYSSNNHAICYRKITRDNYNLKILQDILKYKNIGYVDGKITGFDQVGIKVIADLTDTPDGRKNDNLKDEDIYNQMIYTIEKIDKDNIYLTDNRIITRKELFKYFIPAYCINIHKLQGNDIDNYHWCADDNKFLLETKFKYVTAYVIISRLKVRGLIPHVPLF